VNARKREDGPRIDGILVVAKPAGPTSHDIVALVRRLTGVRRVGHGGTLDPFAMGVLPVFLGRATRMVEYHLADEKRYRATVVFGARSSTDDLDGEMEPIAGPAPTREVIEAALGTFRGVIEQVPPDYSAVHVDGKRAYELARKGDKPELRSRRVTIHSLGLTSWDGSDAERPLAELEVRCSAGTYIRALARDLGAAVASGAYLGALTRTASGPFGIDAAYALEKVRKELSHGRTEALLLPPDAGLEAIPQVEVPASDVAAIARGQVVRLHVPLPHSAGSVREASEEPLVRLVGADGKLAAMAVVRKGRIYPSKVFVTPEA
jgi:tRNA pseudouridine55 synthase